MQGMPLGQVIVENNRERNDKHQIKMRILTVENKVFIVQEQLSIHQVNLINKQIQIFIKLNKVDLHHCIIKYFITIKYLQLIQSFLVSQQCLSLLKPQQVPVQMKRLNQKAPGSQHVLIIQQTGNHRYHQHFPVTNINLLKQLILKQVRKL